MGWWTEPLIGKRKTMQEIRGEQGQKRSMKNNAWQQQLETVLMQGEKVITFAKAHREPGSNRKAGQGPSIGGGYLVVTDRRVLWFSAKSFNRFEIESFGYDKISSFEQSRGYLGVRRVRFHASGNEVSLMLDGSVSEATLVSLMGQVNSRLTQPKQGPAPSAPRPTLADDLRSLSELHEEGILTDAEYAQAKQRRLSTTA